MVESGRIDHGHHAGQAGYALEVEHWAMDVEAPQWAMGNEALLHEAAALEDTDESDVDVGRALAAAAASACRAAAASTRANASSALSTAAR